MRLESRLLGLPASILFLIASQSECSLAADDAKAIARWPFNLLSNLKHPLGESASRAAEVRLGNRRNGIKPTGVIKMSDDEGEKFYMEYWQFGDAAKQHSPMLSMAFSPALRARDVKEAARSLSNASMSISYRPPFALHTEHDSSKQDLRARGALALAVLEKRNFTCPTGTSSCALIGYPNSCCATSETCFQIEDTGLGPVGCCPNGSNCGGTITNCDSPNTACLDNLSSSGYTGGGCCIPDYVCAGVGCVLNSTAAATTVATHTQVASQSSSMQTVVSIVTPVTSTLSVTTTVSTSTYTGLQTTLACSTDSHPCPVDLGGGCCGNGYACASSSSCIATSTLVVITSETTATATGIVPVRPTGSESSSGPSTTDLVTTCPTGFYACEAYYAGGCCRTGRNCDTTSCPATSSTTIISSGATIVVPVGAAATTANPTGNCASGWLTCSASLGGNCCPSGYGCGTASCSLVESTSTVVSPKETPSSGKRLEISESVVVLAVLWALLLLI